MFTIWISSQTDFLQVLRHVCMYQTERKEYLIFYKDILKDKPIKVRLSIGEHSSKNPCTSENVTVNCTYLLSRFQCK